MHIPTYFLSQVVKASLLHTEEVLTHSIKWLALGLDMSIFGIDRPLWAAVHLESLTPYLLSFGKSALHLITNAVSGPSCLEAEFPGKPAKYDTKHCPKNGGMSTSASPKRR